MNETPCIENWRMKNNCLITKNHLCPCIIFLVKPSSYYEKYFTWSLHLPDKWICDLKMVSWWRYTFDVTFQLPLIFNHIHWWTYHKIVTLLELSGKKFKVNFKHKKIYYWSINIQKVNCLSFSMPQHSTFDKFPLSSSMWSAS